MSGKQTTIGPETAGRRRSGGYLRACLRRLFHSCTCRETVRFRARNRSLTVADLFVATRLVHPLRAIGVVSLMTAAAVVVIHAAGATARGDDGQPYKIVCTVGMVADIARNVVGARGDVVNIIGEGIDPHLYQATRNDIARLLKADIVFYSGYMLEGKMTDSLIKVSRRKPVYAVTELVDESRLLSPPGLNGHYDPHLWMDASLWKRCAVMVAQAMGEFDSAHADEYRRNLEQYTLKLDELDAYARRVMATIPEKRRVLVTAHDAFNYMGKAYGIEVRGIQGISTESEAGIDDINELVNLLVDREIRAVFVETSVSDKNVRSLIEGAAARGHQVVIGGNLFSDAMGKRGTYEGTYVGMIDHNVTTIVNALGGTAPQRGMQGKLRSR